MLEDVVAHSDVSISDGMRTSFMLVATSMITDLRDSSVDLIGLLT